MDVSDYLTLTNTAGQAELFTLGDLTATPLGIDCVKVSAVVSTDDDGGAASGRGSSTAEARSPTDWWRRSPKGAHQNRLDAGRGRWAEGRVQSGVRQEAEMTIQRLGHVAAEVLQRPAGGLRVASVAVQALTAPTVRHRVAAVAVEMLADVNESAAVGKRRCVIMVMS